MTALAKIKNIGYSATAFMLSKIGMIPALF